MYSRNDADNTMYFESTAVMDAVCAALDSIVKARKKFNALNSSHEGWAVIREEVHEFMEEMDRAANLTATRLDKEFWTAIRADDFDGCIKEAKHVAAMALSFLIEVPGCIGTVWKKPAAQPEPFIKGAEPLPSKCPDCDVYLLDVRTHNDKGPRGMCPKCRREWTAPVNPIAQPADVRFRPDAFAIAMEGLTGERPIMPDDEHPEYQFIGFADLNGSRQPAKVYIKADAPATGTVPAEIKAAAYDELLARFDELRRDYDGALATIEAEQKENIALREQLKQSSKTTVKVMLDSRSVANAVIEAMTRYGRN